MECYPTSERAGPAALRRAQHDRINPFALSLSKGAPPGEKGASWRAPGGRVKWRPFDVTRRGFGEGRTFQLLMGVVWRSSAALVTLVMILNGCGYEFGTSVKPGAAHGLTVAVPVFYNDTFEPILDKRVTEMVRRQFLQADGLTLVNDVGAAPLALVGHINGYGSGTIAFHTSGTGTNENRVTITASVQLQDTSSKKILWAESYTRTAEFFQTADLATNRSRQDRATDEAAQALAEDIVSRVLEVYNSGELK